MPSALVPPKFSSETRTDTFDMTPYLAAGQTVSGVSGQCTVYTGVDATPSAVLASTSFTSSSVSAEVTGGVTGVIYQIRLDATTTSPAGTLSLSYYLAVIPELP